jgi:hypothetical protein
MSYVRKLITGLPSDQKWGCFSFLRKKDGDENISVVGVRFGGAYSTKEEAEARAAEIQKEDNRFNIFVGELNGDFLPFDPAPNTQQAGSSEYADEMLNKIMKGHEESQRKAALFHELRKTEKMIDNINENMDAQQKNRDDITKKLGKAKTVDEVKMLTTTLEGVEKQIKKLEDRLKESVENENRLKEQTVGMERPKEDV